MRDSSYYDANFGDKGSSLLDVCAMNAFYFRKTVAFYDTDAMGVVHHSNYVRYYEDARVAWLRAQNAMSFHAPEGPFTFAVVDLTNQYLKTARFGDDVIIHVQARNEGVRLYFRYAMYSPRLKSWISTGTTTLVAVDDNLKPAKLPMALREKFNHGGWTETWPPEESPPESLLIDALKA